MSRVSYNVLSAGRSSYNAQCKMVPNVVKVENDIFSYNKLVDLIGNTLFCDHYGTQQEHRVRNTCSVILPPWAIHRFISLLRYHRRAPDCTPITKRLL